MKAFIVQDELWPNYLLEKEEWLGFRHTIDVPQEFYDRYLDVSREYHSMQEELKELWHENS